MGIFKNLSFLYEGKQFFKAHSAIVFLFFLWLYRVDYIPADGGGIAKALQVGTILGILYLIYKKNNRILSFTISRTNTPIKSLLLFYTFAVFSTLWAFVPTFAFFLSFQNLVIILLLIYLNKQLNCFKSIEKMFLSIAISVILFEYILTRILLMPSLFTHSLSTASSAAICFSYSITEYLTMQRQDKERRKYLKLIIFITAIVLITSTSSGANASAIFGLCTGLFFSGHFLFILLIITITLFLYINKHFIDDIILFIMPGKTIESIESVTGRTELWEIMIKLANQKPLLGWGFGCIERAATAYGDKPSPDAHNNYLGVFGSLGYIGFTIFIYHFITSIIFSIKRKSRPGFLGLFSGICCAALNGYSYGFLSGKACSITVIYFAIIVISFYYSKVNVYDTTGIK